jgi:hypothetical protein
MRYEELLLTFAEFFRREGIDYAVTGDLALNVYGHPRTRQRFDFIVDATSRGRTREFMEDRGFHESRRSTNVSVYQSTSQKVAFIFGTVRPSIPGLYLRETLIPLVDPTRRLPLTNEDIDALETATMEMDSQAWMDFTGPMRPRRGNTHSDAPFTL